MAMKFSFNIHPFGYHADPIEFGNMRVHSAGTCHEYSVDIKTKDGWRTINGRVSKLMPNGQKRSGHRNFLHLLRDILNDMDLNELGTDYVHVLAEIKEAMPHVEDMRVGDYKEED